MQPKNRRENTQEGAPGNRQAPSSLFAVLAKIMDKKNTPKASVSKIMCIFAS